MGAFSSQKVNQIWFVVFIFLNLGLGWLGMRCGPLRTTGVSGRFCLAFPLGVAFNVLLLQSAYACGIPVKYGALGVFALGLLGLATTAYDCCRGKLRRIWIAGWPFAVGVAIIVLLSLVSLRAPDHTFLGRAWGDQFNYNSTADYLFKVRASDGGLITSYPYLSALPGSGLLHDRLGQAFLQASAMRLVNADAPAAFFLLTLLAHLLWFCGAWLIANFLRTTVIFRTLVSCAVALTPCLVTVQLESFLSQALGVPLLVATIFPIYRSVRRFHWSYIFISGVLFAATISIYSELLSLALLVLASVAILELRARSKVLGKVVWASSSIVLIATIANGPYLSNVFQASVRSFAVYQGFSNFFPWAFTPQGFTRLVLIDLARRLGQHYELLLGMILSAGSLWFCGKGTLVSWIRREPLWFGVCVLALTPWIICVLPGSRSYQFYKLLQSLWPLTILIALWLCERRPATKQAILGSWLGVATISALAAMFFIVDFRTLAIEARGASARSGMNPILLSKDYRTVIRYCRLLKVRNLFIVNSSCLSFIDMLLTGWLAYDLSRYFDRIQVQPLRMGDLVAPRPLTTRIPTDATNLVDSPIQDAFLSNLSDVAVLQVGASFVRPDGAIFTTLYRDGPYSIYRPVGDGWIFIDHIALTNGKAIDFRADSVSVSSSPINHLRLDVESSADIPGLLLSVEVEQSAKDYPRTPWQWHVYSNLGYGSATLVRSAVTDFQTGPIRRGRTQIYLGPLIDGDNPQEPRNPVTVAIKNISYRPGQ